MNVTERFLKYVKFDTQSDELTNLTPSTPGQYKFAQALEKELQQMGLEDVTLDENGYLMATLPANVDREVPVVGFIAHLDTSPDLSGHNVNPRIVENYDGGDITLNPEKGIVLSPLQGAAPHCHRRQHAARCRRQSRNRRNHLGGRVSHGTS